MAAGDQRLRRPDPQRGIRLATADAEGIDGRLQSRGYQRPEYGLDHDRADANRLFLVVVDPILRHVRRVDRVPVGRAHELNAKTLTNQDDPPPRGPPRFMQEGFGFEGWDETTADDRGLLDPG